MQHLRADRANLTGEEVAIAKTAIRIFRVMAAIGVAVAVPIVLVIALPFLSYALVAGLILAPVLVGVVLYRAGRRNVPQAS
jgi:hypothetical protein